MGREGRAVGTKVGSEVERREGSNRNEDEQ